MLFSGMTLEQQLTTLAILAPIGAALFILIKILDKLEKKKTNN